MADPDSDEEDTFVTLGTPLEVYDEDEVPKKPAAFQEEPFKDKQGRQRFHGAFTGGFSAGYFNTVGSKEGFTPSTFVSSRNQKGEKAVQRPESFMDDEDFDQFGINPLTLAPTDDFTSTRKTKRPATSSGSIIPGDLAALSALILPAKLPVGVKLLRGLGWKEGQGIGPRVKRKVKAKKKSVGQRVYGCPLPGQESEESSSEDEYAQGLSFAPKDVNPINFTPKDDTHGIGYSGIDPSRVFGPTQGLVELFEKPAITKTGRRGITGQAFGVGALEEDDDDIYGTTSMSQYDRVLGGEDDHLHGWTAPGANRNKKKSKFSDNRDFSYVGRVMDGFARLSTTQEPRKAYRPPRIPRDYRPVHVFGPNETNNLLTSIQSGHKSMDVGTRSSLLGDIESVFDLVSRSDKVKMEAAKTTASTSPPTTVGLSVTAKPGSSVMTSSDLAVKTAPGSSIMNTADPPVTTAPDAASSSPLDNNKSANIITAATASSSGSANFKPFARDPHKQQRYEMYISLKKQGDKEGIDRLQENLTEWERERECAEFERAAQMYKPMSLLMASRFQRAQYSDDTEGNVKLPENKKVLTDAEEAASRKMYGKLTRESYEWHPDRVLCKRFNIKNPYPDSTIVGLPMTRRDKYSVFDFLTIPAAPTPPPPPPTQEPTLSEVAAAKTKKHKAGPLAILNKPSMPPAADKTVEPDDTVDDKQSEIEAGPQAPNQVDKEPALPSSVADRPPVDLFKAIFDSDSDSSSSDDDSSGPKNQATTSNLTTREPEHDVPSSGSLPAPQEDSLPQDTSRGDEGMKETREDSLIRSVIQPDSALSEDRQRAIKDGRRGVFDMLNAKIQQEKTTTPQTSEQDQANYIEAERTNFVRDRSVFPGTAPQESESKSHTDFYGPLPPPTATPDNNSPVQSSPSSEVSKKHKHKDKKKDRKRDRSRSRSRSQERHRKKDRRKDRSRSRSRDRKHRKANRSRSRSPERTRRKEEVAENSSTKEKKKSKGKSEKKKKKKSKHKKHKHKSKKTKKSKVSSSDSEDADRESSSDSDDEDVPTSSEILQRLMMLKKRP